MKMFDKIKNKIIKGLGGYTSREYHDLSFVNIDPPRPPCYNPVKIGAKLETDLITVRNNEPKEKAIKKQIAEALIEQIVERELIEYQSEDDYYMNRKIVRGTITVMEVE